MKTKFLNSYTKDLSTLLSGSAFAQIIPILITPLLSRIYSPDEFGLFAIFISICGIFSVFASGRYDASLVEPKTLIESRSLLIGALSINILTFFLNSVLTFCLFFFSIANIPQVFLLIPLSIFLLSNLSIFMNWMNKIQAFRGMSFQRIIYGTVIASFSLLLGWAGYVEIGLILAYVLGLVVTNTIIFFSYIIIEISKDYSPPFHTIKQYTRYPKYLLPANLFGNLSGESPNFFLTRYFGLDLAGYFSFIVRITVTPLQVIGNNIGETYKIHAVKHYHEYGECKEIFLKHLRVLFLIGFFIWFICFFYGEDLVIVVFGENWAQSGIFLKYLSFLLWFQFFSVPLSYTVAFNKTLNLDFLLQFFRLSLVLIAMITAIILNNALIGVQLYSLSFCIFYLLHTIIQYRAALGK